MSTLRRRSLERLARGLVRLIAAMERDRGESGQAMHAFAVRFHLHSARNRALIYLQRPGATMVRGRRQWERDGHRVRPDARPILIVAPNARPGAGRFVWVKVYDAADLQGPPPAVPALPAPADPHGRAGELARDLEAWLDYLGCDVIEGYAKLHCFDEGATDGRRVWVRPGLSDAERAAVLAHEAAHVHLHDFSPSSAVEVDHTGARIDAAQELEAELTAYLLLSMRGLDLTAGTAAYLASHQATRDAICVTLPRALGAATQLATELDHHAPPPNHAVWQAGPSATAARATA